MRPSRQFANIILAVLLASLLGCAGTFKHEATGEYFDDSVINTKVKAAIFEEASLKSAEINVETFKGVVQLSGFVSSSANIDKAVEVTRATQLSDRRMTCYPPNIVRTVCSVLLTSTVNNRALHVS